MNAPGIDPFELLGLPARFDLEKADIEARQRELSKVLHPDRHAGSSSLERRAALNKAMSVNEAVRLLKSPVTRGQALVRRLLRRSASDELPEARVAPALLLEVMEWREELAAAFSRRDHVAMSQLSETARARYSRAKQEVTAAFERLSGRVDSSVVALDDLDLGVILQGLAALKYLERLAEEVRRMEDEIADAAN